jgi:hypothetical protein
MLVAPVGIINDDDLVALRALKSDLLIALTPKPGTCPQCSNPMNLQDRAGDAWWCPGCRLWADSQGRPLPPIAVPRPIYREEAEARKLLADLQAAGCGISWDGDELRITNRSKISTALWMRLDNADSDFEKVAREMAETLENEEASQWVN